MPQAEARRAYNALPHVKAARKLCTAAWEQRPENKARRAAQALTRYHANPEKNAAKGRKTYIKARQDPGKVAVMRERNRTAAKLPGAREDHLAYLAERRRDPARWVKARLCQIRHKCEKAGIPFALKAEDVVMPTHCPVLGFPLEMGASGKNDRGPSLDRLVPSLGYVRGNVVVMSRRANRFKSDCTCGDEMRKVAAFLDAQVKPCL